MDLTLLDSTDFKKGNTMIATTSPENTTPAGGSAGPSNPSHREFDQSSREPRGCGWRHGGRHGGHFGDRLAARMGDCFGERVGARMAARFGAGGPAGWQRVPVDIEDTKDAFVLSLYAPRLDKQAIGIGVTGDILTIRHRPTQPPEESARRFTRRESRSPDFVREFALNGKVRVDAIEASYADGVLTVRLPKTEQAMQPEQKIVVM